MNLLDENFPEDQRPFLRRWRIAHRQIGRDIPPSGVQDEDIFPLLHRLGRVTFFTLDEDFFERRFCHAACCLVFLDVRPDDAAECVRWFLRHPLFNSEAKRMGAVARVHHDGIQFWRRNRPALQKTRWEDR